MEVNKCLNCGLVNLAGDTRCQRCNDLLTSESPQSWTKVAPPPAHNWMADSTPPQQVAPLKTKTNLFPCPDCGRACSISATSCPQCGRPFSNMTAQPPVHQQPPMAGQAPAQIHYYYPPPYPAPQVWSPGIAAILSLFIPGVGQMYKGRVAEGILWLIFTPIGYLFLIVPGLILHILCIVTASQGDPHRHGG